MDIKEALNPRKTGPGAWRVLHLMASQAKTPAQKQAVLWVIELLATRYGCEVCQRHFTEFIQKDPPSLYLHQEEGLFAWTVRAHNNANYITGKEPVAYKAAHKLYYNSDHVCTADCAESEGGMRAKVEYERNKYSISREKRAFHLASEVSEGGMRASEGGAMTTHPASGVAARSVIPPRSDEPLSSSAPYYHSSVPIDEPVGYLSGYVTPAREPRHSSGDVRQMPPGDWNIGFTLHPADFY